MNRKVHIHGQMPETWEPALAALADDLQMTPDAAGLEIRCVRGDALAVESDGASVTVTWAAPVEFYRALSLIPQPLTPCAIHAGRRPGSQ